MAGDYEASVSEDRGLVKARNQRARVVDIPAELTMLTLQASAQPRLSAPRGGQKTVMDVVVVVRSATLATVALKRGPSTI